MLGNVTDTLPPFNTQVTSPLGVSCQIALHQIQLRSRLLDASFMGIYDVTAMEASVVNILHPYLPTFFDHKIQEGIDTTINSNAFDLRMEVKDVAPVCDFFDIPLSVTGMRMAFNISDSLRRMGASVNADSIVYNGIVAKDIDFSFKQKDKMYVGDVQTVVYAKEMKPIKFDLSTELECKTTFARLLRRISGSVNSSRFSNSSGE